MGTQSCTICGDYATFKKYIVKEMMFGTRDEFLYNQCSRCGCLQIGSSPTDLRKYYSTEKYHWLQPFRHKNSFTRRLISKASYRRSGMMYRILSHLFLTDLNLDAISRSKVPKKASILDVGSGSGSTLLKLKSLGYENVIGIDPYIEKEIQEPVVILKKKLSELTRDRKFDLIMFLHSLEHVVDPLSTLQSARELLGPNGIILIRTPLISYAFEKYGEFWYQIDAPRHLVILSKHGMDLIVDKAGLEIIDLYYDSTDAQLTISERYKNNVSMFEAQANLINMLIRKIFSLNLLKAKSLNSHCRGDQGVFYIKKKEILRGNSLEP